MKIKVTTDNASAVADLQKKWPTLNHLDRARAVHAIQLGGTSLRQLARALHCSSTTLRNLNLAAQAPIDPAITPLTLSVCAHPICMEQEDARKLSSAAQHGRRRQVIRAYKRGVTRHRIAQEVGLSYTAVRLIVKRYEDQGIRGLDMGQRGRPASSGRSLTAGQEEHIHRLIKDNRPEQLKMDFALWTRAAVMLLMERECAIKLHVRSVGKYLKRWGFTPQEPIRRAYEKSPAAVQKWLDETCGEIKQRAKQEDAEMHWGNETAVVNTDVRGRGDAPRGNTPVAYVVAGTRQKLSMISTVTNQGKTSWMIIDGNFNHVRLIGFFEALIKQPGRKVFLVLDNPGVHHCAPVKKWLAEDTGQIEVFSLPSGSPELNPDERLNGALKQAIETRVPCRTKGKLRNAASEHMTEIERNPDRVKAFFKDPFIEYAA